MFGSFFEDTLLTLQQLKMDDKFLNIIVDKLNKLLVS